jgi:hypothetical protein
MVFPIEGGREGGRERGRGEWLAQARSLSCWWTCRRGRGLTDGVSFERRRREGGKEGGREGGRGGGK